MLIVSSLGYKNFLAPCHNLVHRDFDHLTHPTRLLAGCDVIRNMYLISALIPNTELLNPCYFLSNGMIGASYTELGKSLGISWVIRMSLVLMTGLLVGSFLGSGHQKD